MSAYLDWKAGDKIVCVNADNNPGCKWYAGEALEKGALYTIGEVLIDAMGDCVVTLVEMPRRLDVHNFPGYFVTRFRKVQKRKTDISCFQAILINPSIKIVEPV